MYHSLVHCHEVDVSFSDMRVDIPMIYLPISRGLPTHTRISTDSPPTRQIRHLLPIPPTSMRLPLIREIPQTLIRPQSRVVVRDLSWVRSLACRVRCDRRTFLEHRVDFEDVDVLGGEGFVGTVEAEDDVLAVELG